MADQDNITESDRKNFARLVAQAWSDDSLTERYQNSPAEVLAEFGIEVRDWTGCPQPRRSRRRCRAAPRSS